MVFYALSVTPSEFNSVFFNRNPGFTPGAIILDPLGVFFVRNRNLEAVGPLV